VIRVLQLHDSCAGELLLNCLRLPREDGPQPLDLLADFRISAAVHPSARVLRTHEKQRWGSNLDELRHGDQQASTARKHPLRPDATLRRDDTFLAKFCLGVRESQPPAVILAQGIEGRQIGLGRRRTLWKANRVDVFERWYLAVVELAETELPEPFVPRESSLVNANVEVALVTVSSGLAISGHFTVEGGTLPSTGGVRVLFRPLIGGVPSMVGNASKAVHVNESSKLSLDVQVIPAN